MYRAELKRIAARFDARRARRHAAALWRAARAADAPAVWRTARLAARLLRAAGVKDVRLEKVPADGVTSIGGWIMPLEWSVAAARLEMRDGAGRAVLADYARNPQSIALFSPPTPRGRWVEGGVVMLEGGDDDARLACARRLGRRLRGKFAFVREGKPDMALNEAAARRGAAALVVAHPGPARDAASYLNYAVPFDARRGCVPVFCLTREAGDRLLAAMGPGLLLRAGVRASRRAGSAPMLTGSLGAGGPPVYLCAHLDEIGAQDNASGCAAAIEALRVLASAARGARRQVRFFFSTEVRGMQWWFNRMEKPSGFLGGINLDMVGADLRRESGLMQTLGGFRHRPHFAGEILAESIRAAGLVAGRVPTRPRFNFTSDAVPGLCAPGGHVSLEQKTGPTYHSSADTPRVLSDATLRWSGAAATSFLYAMTRLDNRDVLRLARRLRRRWLAARKAGSALPEAAPARLAAQALSLRSGFSPPNVYRGDRSPAALYRAGVSRATGLWPESRQKAELDRVLDGLAPPAGAQDLSRGKPLVPLALFRGFLSFEDRFAPREAAELWRLLKLKPAWGTESWAWILASCFDGRRTLDQVLSALDRLDVKIPRARARRLALSLARKGLVRLRPVLGRADILRAVRRAGVRRGSILMAHVSLNRFGYVRGGARAVVGALLDAVGPGGTLAMPTHSNSALGVPPYDPATSRSNTGAVTECFRRMRGVLRSAHPTHSVAALGPRARELVSAHRPDQAPLARDGFWGRLCDLGGDVLLLCPIRSATIFHAGEAWLGLPQEPLIAHALDERGQRRVHVLPNAPWHVDHFEPSLARPMLRSGRMTRTGLGESEMYLARASDMADASVRALRRDPTLCLGRGGECACHHCQALRKGLARGWRPRGVRTGAPGP